MLLQKQVMDPSNHRTTQHGGRDDEQEKVTMCYWEETVCFSPVIGRQSFSTTIVRELCDVWRNMNVDTFVTDKQNTLSLCPEEGQVNLVEFDFVVCLCVVWNLTRIFVSLHLQMSGRTCT